MKNKLTGKTYNPAQCSELAAAGYTSTNWATLNQWNTLNRKVIPGNKSISVTYNVMGKTWKVNLFNEEQTGDGKDENTRHILMPVRIKEKVETTDDDDE